MPPGIIATEFCWRPSPLTRSRALHSTAWSTRRSARSASTGLVRLLPPRNEENTMSEAAAEANIRVNGEPEPLMVATLAALLEEKAVDTCQRGIAVAINGAKIGRAHV